MTLVDDHAVIASLLLGCHHRIMPGAALSSAKAARGKQGKEGCGVGN